MTEKRGLYGAKRGQLNNILTPYCSITPRKLIMERKTIPDYFLWHGKLDMLWKNSPFKGKLDPHWGAPSAMCTTCVEQLDTR